MTNSYPGCLAESGKIDSSQAGLAKRVSRPQLKGWEECKRLRNRWFSSRTPRQNRDSCSNHGGGRKGNFVVVLSINGKITGCLSGKQSIYLLNIDLIRHLSQKEEAHERRQHFKKYSEDRLETYHLASLKIINYALFTCLIIQHYQIQVFHHDSFKNSLFVKLHLLECCDKSVNLQFFICIIHLQRNIDGCLDISNFLR